MEKLLGSKRLDRDLKVAGVVVLSAAPGVALLGWLVGQEYAPWLLPLLGVSGLIGCIGVGLLIASWAVGPAHRQDRPVGPYGRMPKF
jgi:hypothetical protein